MVTPVLQKIALSLVMLLSAQVAQAVTASDLVKDAESVASVTTSAAVRANADVQIRRIKNLMVLTKTGDADESMAQADKAFIKIERLQRDLRGEK